MPATYVVVGAGLAGAAAAATLRADGFDGNLILIGNEQQAPYERPPLSKEYLRGEEPFEKALVHEPAFYEDNGIETRFGLRATRVDPSSQMVELGDNDRIYYDKLLVATGSRNRLLQIPGRDLEGVYGLRTVLDSDRIRAEAVSGRKAVIIGMGFIGCEVAASLRQLGVEVAAVMPGVPLRRVLGEDIGRLIEGIHRDNGVERVTTKQRRSIDCDFVVVGVGAEPVTDFLLGSGVHMDNGVVVDEYCQTNIEGIYAAGDVANHYHPVFERHIRVEHLDNALKQGDAAARSMLGNHSPYDEIPWFWSDQYEYNLQYFGYATEWDELVVRGSLEQRDFVAFYLQGGRLVASTGIDRGRDLRRSAALIKARASVPESDLSNDQVDLRSLVAA
jgi:3-phenylpropionate/trans-cinnamate dioxygenase ferredoxin reductase subunit